jgi:hypothetical protein
MNSAFKIGDLVTEATGDHNTPARIIEVLDFHGQTCYRIRFNDNGLKTAVLPEFRFKKY